MYINETDPKEHDCDDHEIEPDLASPDATEAANAMHTGPHPCPKCDSMDIEICLVHGVTFAECQNCCYKGPANRIVLHEGQDQIGKVRAKRQAQGDWNADASQPNGDD